MKKKIAMALENFSRFSGGAESYAVELAETLDSQGWEVHLIGYTWDGNPSGAIFHKITKPFKFIPPFLRILHFAFRHRSIVREMDLDVVLGFGNTIEMNVYQSHGGVHFVTSLKKTRVENNPLVRLVKVLLTFVSPKSLARSWIESAPFRKRKRPVIVAISDMVRNDICRCHHLRKEDVHLVYNGVNLQRFRLEPDPDSRVNFRQTIGFSNQTLFLFMAYDFRKKGVQYLIDAAGKLQNQVGPGKFGVVIVGAAPSPSLLRQVHELGLESTIVFQGPTKEPEKYYNACDVFVLPTFYDACSLVIFEAMACGLPVITTVDNGASGVITQGVDGQVLNDPRDVPAMAEAMRQFLDVTFLKEASLAASNTASHYSIQSNHDQILGILDSVVQSDLLNR